MVMVRPKTRIPVPARVVVQLDVIGLLKKDVVGGVYVLLLETCAAVFNEPPALVVAEVLEYPLLV